MTLALDLPIIRKFLITSFFKKNKKKKEKKQKKKEIQITINKY